MPQFNPGKDVSPSGLALDLSPMVGAVSGAGEGIETLGGERLVQWARAHDWGRGAYLSRDGSMLHGLLESLRTPNGDMQHTIISLPARWTTIRRWAGY